MKHPVAAIRASVSLSNVGTVREMLNYQHNCMLGTLSFSLIVLETKLHLQASHAGSQHSVAVFGGFIVGSVACLAERGIGLGT